MKQITAVYIIITMLAGVITWASAEEIEVNFYILDNGYCLEQFIIDPSEAYLQANSQHAFSGVFNPDNAEELTGYYLYEKKLIKWCCDMYDIDSLTSKMSINMIMPVFMPSFLWIDTGNELNFFVSCELSENKDQRAIASIAAYTGESLLHSYYDTQKRTLVIINPDNELSVEGIQYPDITMVPVSSILEQMGCELAWNEHKDQISFVYNGSNHVFTFEKGQLVSIDDTNLQALTSIPLGGRRYSWIDGEEIVWMDIDSARSFLNLLGQ